MTSVIVCLLLFCGGALTQSTLKSSCPSPRFPNPAPAAVSGIDGECDARVSKDAESNQNAAKNNFCKVVSDSRLFHRNSHHLSS
jgi:hypothetical protein